MRYRSAQYIIEDRNKSNLLALILALCCPLVLYKIPGTNTSMVLVLFAVAIIATKNVKPQGNNIAKLFAVWTAIYVALNLLTFFLHRDCVWVDSTKTFNTTFFSIAPFGVVMYWFLPRFSLEKFIKIATIIAAVASIIVIYQRLSYIVWGDYFKDFWIPGLPVPDHDFEVKRSVFLDRPAAFFPEPSAFAEYVLPIVLLAMQKKKLWLASILVLGIFASGSTNGLAGLVVIFLVCFVLEVKFSFRTLLTLALIVVGFVYLSDSEFMSAGVAKVDNTDVENYSRLMGSLPVFRSFSELEWIFGLGQGNRLAFLGFNHIFTGIESQDSYINTYFGFLANYGIVGLSVFILLVFALYKKCTKGATNGYLLLFLTLCASTNMMFGYGMIYYMTFIASSKKIMLMIKYDVKMASNSKFVVEYINSNKVV